VLEYGATLRRHPLGVPGTLPTRGWQERLEMIGTVNTFRRADFEVDWADVNGDPRPYVPWWDTEEGSDGDV